MYSAIFWSPPGLGAGPATLSLFSASASGRRVSGAQRTRQAGQERGIRKGASYQHIIKHSLLSHQTMYVFPDPPFRIPPWGTVTVCFSGSSLDTSLGNAVLQFSTGCRGAGRAGGVSGGVQDVPGRTRERSGGSFNSLLVDAAV